MKIFNHIQDLKKELSTQKIQGLKVGLVPTMGAIHGGHLALIEQIKQDCDIVVVSIFVNQKQFDNQQDYNNYPSNIEGDVQKLKDAQVDILFNPKVEEIYNDNFLTTVSVKKLTNNLCGKSRAGHFNGVALIVTKLLNIVQPDVTIFGEKDFQQLQIIRKLVSDLNINTKIISGKIIRESSGLAMSSRNSRLSKKSLEAAPQIYQILCQTRDKIINSKNVNLEEILTETRGNISNTNLGVVDYLEVCDEESLQPIINYNSQIKSRIFIAIYLDQIRLIDNVELVS